MSGHGKVDRLGNSKRIYVAQWETHSKLILELQLKLDNSLSVFDDNLFLFLLLIYLFNIFETWLLCVDQLSWNSLYRLNWLWIHRDHFASTSGVLGLLLFQQNPLREENISIKVFICYTSHKVFTEITNITVTLPYFWCLHQEQRYTCWGMLKDRGSFLSIL